MAAWLRAPGVPAQHRSYCDLVEVGEQAVQAHEMNIATADSFQLADASGAESLTGKQGRDRVTPLPASTGLTRAWPCAQSRATGSRW